MAAAHEQHIGRNKLINHTDINDTDRPDRDTTNSCRSERIDQPHRHQWHRSTKQGCHTTDISSKRCAPSSTRKAPSRYIGYLFQKFRFVLSRYGGHSHIGAQQRQRRHPKGLIDVESSPPHFLQRQQSCSPAGKRGEHGYCCHGVIQLLRICSTGFLSIKTSSRTACRLFHRPLAPERPSVWEKASWS